MKDEKHIDKLFKDRFNDFEVSPSPEVWGSIQTSLEKRKKDRNLIPLWWKMGGVAALLALLLTVGNSVFNTSTINSPILTSDETTRSVEEGEEKNSWINEEVINNEVIASEENMTNDIDPDGTENISEEKSRDNSNSQETIYNKVKSFQNAIAIETKTSENSSPQEKIIVQQNKLIKDNISTIVEAKKEAVMAISNQSTKASENSSPQEKIIVQQNKLIKGNISTIVEAKKEVVMVISNQSTKASEKINQEVDGVQKTNSLIKKDIAIIETIKTDVAANQNNTKKTEAETSNEVIAKTKENKQSILDAIEEQKKIIKEEEAFTEEKTKVDRPWEVAPNFAPVYYSSLGNGSSIDPSFADNSQTGAINYSYGVQVSYAVSERFSVRSGMNSVDLSYTTAGVELGTGPVSAALKSIDYGGRAIVLTAVDKYSLGDNNMNDGGNFGEIMPKATNGDANIVQNISYYEVPVELKYALVNNKIGVNVIGGVSTLFLGSNEVSVNAGDFESTLGEANNLSSVSFSTNVGLGFDYKLSKKFKFNIEPMFKYQLNPYSDSSVDFKPYYLGVYTGLSYKF